jgi:hypothetical protein
VRVVVLAHERLQRRHLADEIAHRHAPVRRLRARQAERDPRGDLRVASDDEHRRRAVERRAGAHPFVVPGGERALIDLWSGHGAPA